MKKTKKIISLLLSFLMIITSVPLIAVNSFAAEDDEPYYEVITSGDYNYVVLDDGTAKIIDYIGSATELSIPSEIDGYRVTSIGGFAFYYSTSLTSITIPDSVTSIGSSAFKYCESLTNITIPDSVISIGQNAFYDTAHYNDESNWDNGILYIGNHLMDAKKDISGSVEIKRVTKTIADYAFSRCEFLTNITIPDSVTSIGDHAFDCRSLTSITIPDSVTSIGHRVFEGCSSLAEINVGRENSNYSSEKGVLFNKDKTVLICYPAGKTGTSYSIPDGVMSIDDYAFYECESLTSITIPDSVTSIGDDVFRFCTSLTNITIPNSVTSIGAAAFECCESLTNITIPNSVTSIGAAAFECCESLTNITIPDSVTIIGDATFWGCTSLTSITLPDSVTSISRNAFDDTAYYNDESNWDNGIFYVDNHLIEVKSDDISGSLEIRQGTKTIPDYAFSWCESLTSITIPDSVMSIGYEAFYYCTSLTEINVDSRNANYSSENGILFNKDKTEIVRYPTGKTDTSYSIPNGVTSIGDDAFYYCTSLTNITIPNSVTSIGAAAFECCQSLTNITIPDSVISIGQNAFYDTAHYNDESNWDNGILYIGNHLIDAKVYISGSLEIRQGTKTIADFAIFNDYELLKSVTIPVTVKTIGRYALGYVDQSGKYFYASKIEGFTIYGVSGSEAERYANENEFTFEEKLFPDVASGEWYYNAIKFNVDNGYFHGYGNGYFGPADNIQRQDFVVVLAKIANADLSAYEGQNGDFDDVPMNDYYSAAIAWAKDNKILSGYADGRFGVGDPITREQACVIFYNYCHGSVSGDVNTVLADYPDGSAVSDWARTAVAWAAENHVVGGNGKLNPAGNANRAEMAQIIMNMSNNDIL